nr:aminotransferase class I/II-fold pyridoxal phosphate-dependent enzyme [Propionibacterium sp.]
MTTFAEAVDATSIDTLLARGSAKWTTYPDRIGAWIAEMDFGVAPPVQDALDRLRADVLYGYPNRAMLRGLREATAGFCALRYGWSPDPDTIVAISDVLHGLGVVLDVYVPPDAPVVLLTPCYMPFLTVPPAFGRRVVQVPMLRDEHGWTVDQDALAAALTPGALFVLANPFNPLGKVFTRTELAAISEIVEARGARVFSDEIHAPITFPGHQHVPYATVSPAAAAHSITALSASKAWNLAGLKCAQLVLTNPDDLALWRRVAGRRAAEAANPGIVAGTAAYTEGLDWLAEALAYLDGNRRLVAAELPARIPGARTTLLEGTYLQFVDFRETAVPGNPRQFFFDHARVALTDGDLCGEAGRGFVRLNIATPTPILREILDRLAAAAAEA